MRLRRYPEEISRLKIIGMRIKLLESDAAELGYETDSERITGECLQSSLGHENIGGGQPSSPTERVALMANQVVQELRSLRKEAERLSASTSAVRQAMDDLPERERYLLEQRYFQRLPWSVVRRKVADKYMVYSSSRVFECHKEAIQQLQRTLTGKKNVCPKKEWKNCGIA